MPVNISMPRGKDLIDIVHGTASEMKKSVVDIGLLEDCHVLNGNPVSNARMTEYNASGVIR